MLDDVVAQRNTHSHNCVLSSRTVYMEQRLDGIKDLAKAPGQVSQQPGVQWHPSEELHERAVMQH